MTMSMKSNIAGNVGGCMPTLCVFKRQRSNLET